MSLFSPHFLANSIRPSIISRTNCLIKHHSTNHLPSSIMASSTKQCSEYHNPHVCSIIPPNLLQHILNASENSDNTKAAAKKTFNHVCRLQTSRVRKDYRDYHHHPQAPTHGFTAGIIPPQIFKAALASEDTSSQTKERAQNQLKVIEKLHSARADQAAELKKPTAHVYRSLYTSAQTDIVNKTLLFEEGADTKVVSKDIDASQVYDFFGKTYQFYSEVCFWQTFLQYFTVLLFAITDLQ